MLFKQLAERRKAKAKSEANANTLKTTWTDRQALLPVLNSLSLLIITNKIQFKAPVTKTTYKFSG